MNNEMKVGKTDYWAEKGKPLPFIVEPTGNRDKDLASWAASRTPFVASALRVYGGLLFRGFNVPDARHFRAAFRILAGDPLEYTERSSPRRKVEEGIFTSTSYPSEREIFLHNEQSYNLNFPRFIAFYCQVPAKAGGETPLADTRKILSRLNPEIIGRLGNQGYLYVRNFSEFGIPWTQAFQVNDADALEHYCRVNEILFKWLGPRGTNLRTSQHRPVIAQHPVSGELVWFNHLTFFHAISIDQDLRRLLEQTVDATQFPHATYYVDGSSIEDPVVHHFREAYRAEERLFSWQSGDVLLLDNMFIAHGRRPFTGDRRVLVSMAEPCSWKRVAVRADVMF